MQHWEAIWKNGCLWDENTCSNTVWGGQQTIFKWALENECPCEKYTYSHAVDTRKRLCSKMMVCIVWNITNIVYILCNI